MIFIEFFCRHLYINTIENGERMFYNDYIATRNVWDERVVCMDKDAEYCVKFTEERKEELLHIISDINDAGTIEYLHTFIKLFMERWG